MSALSQAADALRVWRHEPVRFVRDVFKVEPDAWQLDALAACGGALSPRRRLVMKACTGPGKSAVLAWIGWHRLACFGEPGEAPKGAALSITADNLRDNLWAELAKWQERSDFLKAAFEWTAERVSARENTKNWFLSKRSFAKDADSNAIGQALSGLHSKYPFVLLDEVGDMPLAVGQRAEQIFTGAPADALIAAAGNPTSTSGLLYHLAVSARKGWVVITITADPDDPKRTPRVDPELAREAIEKWGRDNVWVMATILGQFPKVGFNSLLAVEDVEAAMRRVLRPDDYKWAQKRIGVDVARFGDDRTTIAPRQGLFAARPVVLRSQDSLQVAARVALAHSRWGAEQIFVDGTGGWGSGVIDNLRMAGHSVLDVNASGSAQDPMYFNARTEMWFRMAQWVKGGGCLPNDPDLLRELTTATYSFKDGRLLLEPKELMKKRLGYSPDLADGYAQTFYLPEMPGNFVLPNGAQLQLMDPPKHRETSWDYNPLERRD